MQQAELSEAKQSERGQRESLHHMTDLEGEKAQTGAREKRRPKDQSGRATPERKPANTNTPPQVTLVVRASLFRGPAYVRS